MISSFPTKAWNDFISISVPKPTNQPRGAMWKSNGFRVIFFPFFLFLFVIFISARLSLLLPLAAPITMPTMHGNHFALSTKGNNKNFDGERRRRRHRHIECKFCTFVLFAHRWLCLSISDYQLATTEWHEPKESINRRSFSAMSRERWNESTNINPTRKQYTHMR